MQVVGHRGETGPTRKSHVERPATHGGLDPVQYAQTLEMDRYRTVQLDAPHRGGDRRWSSDGKEVVASTCSSPDQRKLHRKSLGPLLQHDQAP